MEQQYYRVMRKTRIYLRTVNTHDKQHRLTFKDYLLKFNCCYLLERVSRSCTSLKRNLKLCNESTPSAV